MVAHPFPGRHTDGVAIEAYAVAHLAAQHLPNRHTPGLARQVPAGHLDAGDTAAIAAKSAVLLDFAEYLRHIARVHSDDAALQHQAVRLAAIVADFAIPGYALVGIETEDRKSTRLNSSHRCIS